MASTPAGPSSTVVMPPGRYGSLDAHTEAAKIESIAMTTKQSEQISKLEETMQKERRDDAAVDSNDGGERAKD